MTDFDWLADFHTRLDAAGVRLLRDDAVSLAPARRWVVERGDWGRFGESAAGFGLRYAGSWGDEEGEQITVRCCLVKGGDYLVVETAVPLDDTVIASHAPYFAGAGRMERHLRDLLGVEPAGCGDVHRWTRHQAWRADEYPLRSEFPVAGHPPGRTRADVDYPFERIQGPSVCEIPVGPVHAGIIEPGHFRFQAVGEQVLQLEERLGYVHKGVEKIAVGRDAARLARLAARVSGDSTVAHGWAACQAMERAAGCDVPPRALHLRAAFAERERIANHLGDIGAVCNDVGFAFAHVQCARLRERWQRRNAELFGHRLLMDRVVPGGVAVDLAGGMGETLRDDHAALRRELAPLFDVIDDHPSLENRLLGTGCLGLADALALGCTGYVGKASGCGFDVRSEHRYGPYDSLDIDVPVRQEGDAAARVRVRMDEVLASLDLLDRLLATMPAGEIAVAMPPVAGRDGIGLVDGWRGEVLTYVRFADDGTVARFFPRDPSWFTWPALERLIAGNIVPDFPVCNKSVNGSYSGHDL